ncbi:MAG: RHS repeat-associated core domain-containing protein [Opitutaceae bacterium]|jgi:RHS repeat-associated protein
MKTCILAILVLGTSLSSAQVPYPGNDCDHGPVTPQGFLNPYTGNVSFATNDITVAGAVGEYGLTWKRFANSRTVETRPLFGLGHNWAYNWQWEMVDAGTDSLGRAMISVREPQGWVHLFTEVSRGQWWSAPSVRDHVISDGDCFRVLRWDAGEIRFTRQTTRQGQTFSLSEIADPIGNVWRFNWSGGELIQVTEPAGRWLKIEYKTIVAPSAFSSTKPCVVISKVSASDGQQVSYNYEFLKGVNYPVLTKVSYPDDTVAQYTYEPPRSSDRLLLTQATDPHADSAVRGRKFHYRSESDAAKGQLLKVVAADGGQEMQRLSADTASDRTYAIKQTNGVTVYRMFALGGNVIEEVDGLGFTVKHEYDADNRGIEVKTINQLGQILQFTNDHTGQPTNRINPDGTSRSCTRDEFGRVLTQTDELGHTVVYTRDASGRVMKIRYPDGSAEDMTYNDFGQVLTRRTAGGALTAFAYDARGLLVRTMDALGFRTSYSYTALDRLATTTDARGNTTRYERDAAGRAVRVVFADGAATSVAYDKFGQLTERTDPTGVTERFIYDAFGRKVSSTNALGNETRRIYGVLGVDATPFERPVKTTLPSGIVTALGYDANGRVISSIVAAGTKDEAITRIAYDPIGHQTNIVDPRGKTVRLFYNERGRCIKMMTALNHAKTWIYDAVGHKLSEIDAKGNTITWAYDAMGRELSKTDAKGQVTRREYDAAGRLAALTDPKGSTYRFAYDLLGRQTALVYPDGSRETTAYDAVGLKVCYTNRAGTVQTFAYDNRNHEIRSDWNDGSQTIIKAYDAAGRMTVEDNGISRINDNYDSAGRLASETQDLSSQVTGGQIDPAPKTISYTYNADGRREALGYPDGTSVKFAYNVRGQLQDILGDGVPPPITSYEYDAAGNAIKMPRGNLTETAREYDAENKVTSIKERPIRRSPLSELDYTYDEAGNRTSTTETLGSSTSYLRPFVTRDTYLYDATYQLTGADHTATVTSSSLSTSTSNLYPGSSPSSVRFTYDAVGNRIEVAVDGKITHYSVNNLNQYTQVGDFVPSHDRNGNLVGMNQWLYKYDALNRLISASNGTMTARFYYDAKNRCVARRYNGAVMLNTYDNWSLIEEHDGSGIQIARYVHGRQVDEIAVMVNRHGVFYPHYDVLGNVTMLTDTGGKLAERYAYGVTGQMMISDASGERLTKSAIGNRWMFTGREWLQEVEIYDYRNRAYSVALGRFLQTDPIRFAAGDLNIYRYVFNRPNLLVDPFGLGPNDPDQVWAVSSDAFGIPGINHVFYWNPRLEQGKGRDGSSGYTWGSGVPNNFGNSDFYATNSGDKAQQTTPDGQTGTQYFNSINNSGSYNSGLWVPYINDCWTDANDAADAADGNFTPPSNGRFDWDEQLCNALNNLWTSISGFFNSWFE